MHFSPVTQVQQRQSVQTTSLQAPSWQGLVTWRQRQTQKRDKGCWYATLFGVPSYKVWWADLRTADSTQGTLVWELHWLSHSHWVNVPTWGWRGIEVEGDRGGGRWVGWGVQITGALYLLQELLDFGLLLLTSAFIVVLLGWGIDFPQTSQKN